MPLCDSPQPEMCGCEIHCGCNGTCSIHKYNPFERKDFQKISEEDLEYLKGEPASLKFYLKFRQEMKAQRDWAYFLIVVGLVGIAISVVGFILKSLM